MSPYELTILLEVYAGKPISANPAAPLFAEIMSKFEKSGWTFRAPDAPDEWVPTEKLNVFMYHILSLPEPVWKMPC